MTEEQIERQPWFCEFPRKVVDEVVRQVREIQAIPVPSDEHIEVIAEAVWNGLCDSGAIAALTKPEAGSAGE